MNRSEQINELAEALAKAQGAVDNAAKASNNPHFKTKYADLASVREAIREPFSANGLSYVQFLRWSPNVVEIETMLMHKSGQFLSDTLPMPIGKNDAQAVGSAATYGRRYSLMAIAGIAPDEDDDGNAAVASSPRPSNVNGNYAPARPSAPEPRRQITPAPVQVDDTPFDDELSSEAREAFLASAKATIANTDRSYADIAIWWNAGDQRKQRRDFDLSTAQIDELKAMIAARRPAPQEEAAE
jgi:hypothetical protein